MIHLASLQVRLLQTIASRLSKGAVGLIYLDVATLERIEGRHGRACAEELLLFVRRRIDELRATFPNVLDQKRIGDDFFLYVALGDVPAHLAYAELERIAEALRADLEEAVRRDRPEAAEARLDFGCALLRESEERELEAVMYTAMKQAIRHARERTVDPERITHMQEFYSILESRHVASVYQPIVSMEGGEVFGYEALSRGPAASPLHSPVKLFELAERADKLYALDKLTREQAILGIDGLARHQRIFLNIPAQILHDPDFSPGQTLALLQRRGLTPNNVVLEITERSSIEDFSTAKKVIDHYRSQGYRIAIDDAGAGYSSLQAIAEIQPDYIKVDRSLVQGIHRDKVKEYILETFVWFAKRLNIKVIAEGIEEAEELEKLIRLGVHYAQGYFLGRPDATLKPVTPEAKATIYAATRLAGTAGLRTVGDVAATAKTFQADDPVSFAATYFRDHPDQFGAVVVEGSRPVGLLMRDELFRKLSVQYGISLFWSKPVKVVADLSPLTVDADTPLETVSSLATMRESGKLYDLVVVTERGELAGVVTVRDILEHMTSIRMEHARVANPLTGLPGNVQIQRELQRRVLDGEPFSVLYVDIDFFKWFNDLYGFQRGDEAIQLTADVIRRSVAVCGRPRDFVGHIGGDDFIVITGADAPETVAEEIIRRFRLGIDAFYDGQPQGTTVQDRYGRTRDVEALSVSIALVRVEDPSRASADAISRTAADCKRQAKAKDGSAVASAAIAAMHPLGLTEPSAPQGGSAAAAP
ncbi:GGDEF domain-containing protein [Paenibacillus antri]|uniref:GGDEF domain-containing protein n=1 Tax=Paenibacillus antri TaxID=2582848 RepID=A0A5R9FWQ9_9BACL|nr:GGDEF domain-containing protein [Paenibacillus antri]TLS48427.1 GGDEF domain-containing protein [Paenibacillus antri]